MRVLGSGPQHNMFYLYYTVYNKVIYNIYEWIQKVKKYFILLSISKKNRIRVNKWLMAKPERSTMQKSLATYALDFYTLKSEEMYGYKTER